MSINSMMRDKLTLIKQDGIQIEGIKGNVQQNKIFIPRDDVSIETDDEIIRAMPNGKVECYIVIEPNFYMGQGSIPSGYQVEVKRKTQTKKIKNDSSTESNSISGIMREEIESAVEKYINLCVTVVNNDSTNYQHHILTYQLARQKLLEYADYIKIPAWVKHSVSIPNLQNNVSLKISGGAGGWQRRRTYFQEEMNNMLDSIGKPRQNHSISAIHESLQEVRSVSDQDFFGQDESLSTKAHRVPMTTIGSVDSLVRKKVFIVHGHDEQLKNEVFIFLTQEGYEPIVLHHQSNNGDTIIEKLERYIDSVSFAVVLYTPCDMGKSKSSSEFNYRARQNVVFEHGYLISKLTRKRVVAIKADEVEVPGDLSGLVYISSANWQYQLQKELKSSL